MRFEANDGTTGLDHKVLSLNDTAGRMVLVECTAGDGGIAMEQDSKNGFKFQVTQSALLQIWNRCGNHLPKVLVLERYAADFDFDPRNLEESLRLLPTRVPRARRIDKLLPFSADSTNTETGELTAKAKAINELVTKLTGEPLKPSKFVNDEDDEECSFIQPPRKLPCFET